MPARIISVRYGTPINEVGSWTDMLSQLVADQSRNALIARWADRAVGYAPTLVLVDRIEHAERLGHLCQTPNVVAHGSLKRKALKQAMSDMEHAALTIGTTGLLGEGLDV